MKRLFAALVGLLLSFPVLAACPFNAEGRGVVPHQFNFRIGPLGSTATTINQKSAEIEFIWLDSASRADLQCVEDIFSGALYGWYKPPGVRALHQPLGTEVRLAINRDHGLHLYASEMDLIATSQPCPYPTMAKHPNKVIIGAGSYCAWQFESGQFYPTWVSLKSTPAPFGEASGGLLDLSFVLMRNDPDCNRMECQKEEGGNWTIFDTRAFIYAPGCGFATYRFNPGFPSPETSGRRRDKQWHAPGGVAPYELHDNLALGNSVTRQICPLATIGRGI